MVEKGKVIPVSYVQFFLVLLFSGNETGLYVCLKELELEFYAYDYSSLILSLCFNEQNLTLNRRK